MEDTRAKRSNEVMEGQSETGAGNISISPSTHHCSTSKTVLRAGRYASNTFLFLLFPDIKLKRVPTVCQRVCLNTKEAHSTTVEISTRYFVILSEERRPWPSFLAPQESVSLTVLMFPIPSVELISTRS